MISEQEVEDDQTFADSDSSSSSASTDSKTPREKSSTDDELLTLSDNDGNPMVSSDSSTSSDEGNVPTPMMPVRGRARLLGGRGTRGRSIPSRSRGRFTVRTRGSRRGCNSARAQAHFLTKPQLIPPTEKKQRPTKPCRVCTQKKIRRESRYICAECKEKPALCIVHPTQAKN
ncbi:hypothetical protein LOTGIDRAFT_161049 [Lottia gigantea]|uniref:Uncharacterized protein n=1 Tax=Lottia gigantea TaxID=225164 RepID=V4AD66_LOTGI|nr:hypothetical protein LOTGIDRAFT_161049 [Lottia gigantea]ESO94797.1 hypothetical protein LOTGIDRAFT_161049 [Lottia gigantea]